MCAMTSCWSSMKTASCSSTTWPSFGRRERRGAHEPARTAMLWLSLAPLLGGCIPFATPYLLDSDSRGDVTTAVEQQFEVGKNTRTDFLLLLVRPDGRALDDSWFTYSSARTSEVGGMLFLVFD